MGLRQLIEFRSLRCHTDGIWVTPRLQKKWQHHASTTIQRKLSVVILSFPITCLFIEYPNLLVKKLYCLYLLV